MSRTGLMLCSAYAVVIGTCVALALPHGADPKGDYVLLQLPIALQSAALSAAGLGPLLGDLSWPAAYAVLGTPAMGLLYGLGVLVDRRRGRPSRRPR